MILRHRIAVNGVHLDAVDGRILVCGIAEPAASEAITAASRFGGVGQRLTGRHREYLDVTVKFALRVKASALSERRALYDQVVSWAMAARDGAWITVGHRPGQRLRARLYQLPPAGDLAEWASEYPIVFRAYGVPHWQASTPAEIEVANTSSAQRTLAVGGTDDTVVNVTFENTSGGQIDTASIQAGDSRIELMGLGLMAGETLSIAHNSEGILRIRIQDAGGEYRSAMAARTEASADDLWVSPGSCAVRFSAGGAGNLAIRCYARYA